ncbi:LOW QUALITY PROTEIN: uncharacterized protein ACR2FA_002069 [Aphomia sociella]
MECDDLDKPGVVDIEESDAAVNPLILDYYKKFGRKRDLEQYFSLSTAQSEIRDPTGLFWRRMKSQDSSDSGEKRSESSTEICRISIKCSVPEACSSQDETSKAKSDSESPPIIMEDVASKHSDDEYMKSDDNHSQKSTDAMLDTSLNKPLSPSSSITSQRKLEWDSLADVGYANESDRKTSASSLSTLERLALKQQYTNNDTKLSSELEPPTAHSTPLEQGESKIKGKRGVIKRTTIYKKDVDYVEVNVPHSSDATPSQAINVNLTKHISFNVEKDGAITFENIKNDVNVTPEKVSVETEVTPQVKLDKEIQTSLTNTREINTQEVLNKNTSDVQRIPLMINLNTLKKIKRRKKIRTVRRKRIIKKKIHLDKEKIPTQERSAEQVSEAESFEYMPGHIYNQNQLKQNESKQSIAGNKSSLESSGALTTDSSKASKHSFSKDLKSIDVLKMVLQHRRDDSSVKKQLIKEIVQRLLNTKYRDDESTTEFLSGLSFSSNKLGLGESHTTTSTSDGNTTGGKTKMLKPKKSILRLDKFNPSGLASTSQSAPNLPSVTNSERPVTSNLIKLLTSSHTESDISSKEKNSSDTAFAKTSSEELYQKYLDALRREEAYKRHLRDKENFMKQKLVSSDNAFKIPFQPDVKTNKKLKELVKDLTRNNYNDGSGDASKLEGGSNSNIEDVEKYNVVRRQKSHSVFTLSPGNSEVQSKKVNLKKRLQNEINETKTGHYKNERPCFCRHNTTNVGVTDSSVQVDIKLKGHDSPNENKKKEITLRENVDSIKLSSEDIACVVSDNKTRDKKYMCLCGDNSEVSDNLLIYKCSRLANRGTQLEEPSRFYGSNNIGLQCVSDHYDNNNDKINQPSTSKTNNYNKNYKNSQSGSSENIVDMRRTSQSSQTNIALNLLRERTSGKTAKPSSSDEKSRKSSVEFQNNVFVHESTRWIQTEISINPRISDPSLTDIVIINDEDCVKLTNEKFRKVSNRKSEQDITDVSKQKDVETDSNSDKSVKVLPLLRKSSTEFDKVTYSSSPSTVHTTDKEVQSNIESNTNFENVKNKLQALETAIDNFTIPIQGTNMTLKVTIGSNAPNSTVEKQFHGMPDRGTDAIEVDVDEKATCLREECTKGIQSQVTDIFTNMINETKNSPLSIDHNSNKVLNTLKKSCIVNSCYPGDESNYNTYPKNIQINEPKPFRRSNTDPDRIEKACGIQTDYIIEKDAITQGFTKSDTEKLRESDTDQTQSEKCRSYSDQSSKNAKYSKESKDGSSIVQVPSLRLDSRKSSSDASKDPILDMIQDITRRYSKKDLEKGKRKKCFKEIITVLNYLLNTDDSDPDQNQLKKSDSSSTTPEEKCVRSTKKLEEAAVDKDFNKNTKIMIDKAVQLSARKSKENKNFTTESSEIPASSDLPSTSSDSATCKVLNKIKKECEKYHQKRCKGNHGGAKKCEVSSSTSVNCEKCKRIHHCSCRSHKCKLHKIRTSPEKSKKKCVAYNLIIQTSDSMVSEETMNPRHRSLQNIIVKVPPKRKQTENVPFKEMAAKIEKDLLHSSPRHGAKTRSRSLPNECDASSTDDVKYAKMNQVYTVRDYLEKNRPDFVENCSSRQNCLKFISESRANERIAKRQLLSLRLDKQPAVTAVSESKLRELAKEIGVELRRKKLAPKFISEKEMKKHSENIYKSLPEVVQKKEEKKKENIKKTNLLMASIFKKNLQKKTLRGSVNISNYSTVIKI